MFSSQIKEDLISKKYYLDKYNLQKQQYSDVEDLNGNIYGSSDTNPHITKKPKFFHMIHVSQTLN